MEFFLQLQQLDILQGCSRWSIHSHPDVTVETGLLLRFDVYFQLSIVFDGQNAGGQDDSASAKAILGLTPQGERVFPNLGKPTILRLLPVYLQAKALVWHL